MKRLKKAFLLPVRRIAYKRKHTRLYYWAERKLFELRAVYVMPNSYYSGLYRSCSWLIEFRKFRKLANRVIHTIPLHVRFELA